MLAQASTASSAQSVETIVEKYNLLGTFAWDCSKPPSRDNEYFINRVVDADHVQRDQMSGPNTRDSIAMTDARTKPSNSCWISVHSWLFSRATAACAASDVASASSWAE